MKPETLENLLLDQALGELPREVEELLETHLALNPEAARQAAGLATTVQLARKATALKSEAPPQPLAAERLQAAQAAMRRRSIAWELTKLAACGVLGLILGLNGHFDRGRPANAIARPAGNPELPAVVSERGQVPENRQDFWSVANLAAAQREWRSGDRRLTSRYRLHWDSPIKMPQVEENL